METIEIGGVPHEETCVATGVTENAQSLNQLECRAYIAALRRTYGPEPEGVTLRTKGNAHDFGTYYEVVCTFDYADAAARSYATSVEKGIARWFDAGMWPPVVYDDNSQPVSIIRDPALWLRDTNPGAYPTQQRRDAAVDGATASPAG